MSPAPSAPLRGAIVGFGFISEHGHLPAYLASRSGPAPFEVVAVADPTPDRLRAARRYLPDARLYEDPNAMLAAEADRLDFVDLSVPPALHAPLAHAALDRGLHVLCEKPLASSAGEARAMLAHAERARRVLFPCHNYKHAPVVRAVREVLDAGDIGRVRLVTLDTFRPTHARGVQEWRPDWRRERRFSGGGIAMDHGSHTFYLAFEWLHGYPTSVTARTWTLGAFDTEDNMSCAITFPDGIAMANLTWTAGARRVIYTLHGEQGLIRVEDDDIEVTRLEAGARPARKSVASDWKNAGHPEWFVSLLAQFASAVQRSEFVGSEARDALWCVDVITTAYASAAQGSRELPLGGSAE